MSFLDKIKNTVNKLADQVDSATQNASAVYKEKGFKGLLDATDEGITKATDKTREYFTGVLEESRKNSPEQNEQGQPVSKVEATLNTAIKATQTVAQDVAQGTKTAWEKLSQDTGETQSENTEPVKAIQPEPVVEKPVIVDRLKQLGEDSVSKPVRKVPAKKTVKKKVQTNTVNVDNREIKEPATAKKRGETAFKSKARKSTTTDTDNTPKVTRIRKPR